MPEDPMGSDSFKFGREHPENNFKATESIEGLGDMHLATENYSVALEYYTAALQKSLASGSGDLVRIYRKISDCYRKKGMLKQAMAFLEDANLNRTEDDQISRGIISCRRGIIYYEKGKIKEALREGCEAYKVLRTSDEHREVAHTQLLIANCYSRMGKPEKAEQFFLDALSSYRRINDVVGESYVLNNLGLFHKNACRWGRALQFLNRALEICEETGLSRHEVRVRLNLGIVHLKKRDFAEAETAFTRVREMAKRTGDDLKYTRATLMLGVKETMTGHLLLAEKHLLEGRVKAEKNGYSREIALSDEFLGDYMFARGDYEGALENYGKAVMKAEEILPGSDIAAETLRRKMSAYLALKNPEEVVSVGKKALEIAKNCEEVHEIGFIERTMGKAYAMLGDHGKTKKYINSSIRVFLAVNNPYEAHRSGYYLGRHMHRQGGRKSLVTARKLIKESLSYFERTEEFEQAALCHFELARIYHALDNVDESLLHVYEASHIAGELGDRNFIRRLKRFRKKIERAAIEPASKSKGEFSLPENFSSLLAGDSNLSGYLDYILSDLMIKLEAHHGFVSIYGNSPRDEEPLVLARRGVSDKATIRITNWFRNKTDEEISEECLVTDVEGDRRISGVRGVLPGGNAPVYFHPLVKEGKTTGLLFFQSENGGAEAPRLGSIYDVVSTYAGFISFLIKGIICGTDAECKDTEKTVTGFESMITRDEGMLNLCNLAQKVASTDSTVLLMGETGTGKGLVAKAVHKLSTRRFGKFVHVNCAALPENILESELFGHVKGAFTGAVVNKQGLLAEADGGTAFLDEIGKMPLSLQGKLLQFLDTSRVRPVGSNTMKEIDVRLVFASKVDLLSLCKQGGMLEDFYYRINDFPLTIPPLRERPDDIRLLADHYTRQYSRKMNKNVMGISTEAYEKLLSYDWPGNVRELEKVIKRAIILVNGASPVTPVHLVFDSSVTGSGGDRSKSAEASTLPEKIEALESEVIAESLNRNSWNRKAASRSLGISYPTLLSKIRKYGITRGN